MQVLRTSFAGLLVALLPLSAMAQSLTQVTVKAEMVEDGRAMLSADRGNFLIVDSVPPLDGPNVALNPTELMVGSLATCAIFVAKATLESNSLPFDSVRATVEGDFNPKSVKSGKGDPSFQNFRITYNAPGLDQKVQDTLKKTLPKRCPIFATLTKAAKINVGFAQGEAGTATEGLATVTVNAQLHKDGTRGVIQTRNHYLVVDSVPPLGGKNETLNPIDLMLAAQTSCVLFVAEANLKKSGGKFANSTASVTGQFDPRGVKGEDVNPRIQKIDVSLNVPDLSAKAKSEVIDDIKKRCPIYTTLNKSAKISFQ